MAVPGRKIPLRQRRKLCACGFEVGDARREVIERQTLSRVLVSARELAEKASKRSAVGAEVEGQHIGVREAQGDDAPDPRERGVVAEVRISDVRHPEMIVVAGMIDPIVSGEPQVHHRPSQMIEEHRVIGTAADPRLHEIRIGRGRGELPVARPSGPPRLVQRLAGRGGH